MDGIIGTTNLKVQKCRRYQNTTVYPDKCLLLNHSTLFNILDSEFTSKAYKQRY